MCVQASSERSTDVSSALTVCKGLERVFDAKLTSFNFILESKWEMRARVRKQLLRHFSCIPCASGSSQAKTPLLLLRVCTPGYPVTVVCTPPAQPLSPGRSSPPSVPGTRLDLMIFQQHWSKILPTVPPPEHGLFPPSSAL